MHACTETVQNLLQGKKPPCAQQLRMGAQDARGTCLHEAQGLGGVGARHGWAQAHARQRLPDPYQALQLPRRCADRLHRRSTKFQASWLLLPVMLVTCIGRRRSKKHEGGLSCSRGKGAWGCPAGYKHALIAAEQLDRQVRALRLDPTRRMFM